MGYFSKEPTTGLLPYTAIDNANTKTRAPWLTAALITLTLPITLWGHGIGPSLHPLVPDENGIRGGR